MNWWKAHHGIATDRKYPVIQRWIESNALRNVTPPSPGQHVVRRSDIASVWLWLIDFASQNTPRGSIDGYQVDEIATSTDIPDEHVEAIIKGFEWREMINGNTLTAFEFRNGADDKNGKERQRRFRDNQKARNALRNVTPPSPPVKSTDGDGDGDGDGEVLVVKEHLPATEVLSDGRTKRAGKEHVTAFGSSPHEIDRPTVRPSDIERISFMRDAIYGYMSMAGTPYQRNCKPPDDAIVLQCLGAVGSADMRRVADFLRDRFVNSEQSPRHPNGPRKYAWFVSVLTEQFGGHAKNGRQAQR